jgi:hypothetical protein
LQRLHQKIEGDLARFCFAAALKRLSFFQVFDPFMYLSVPLPEAKTRPITALVWSRDLTKLPTKYLFDVPKYGTIQVCSEKTRVLFCF